MKYIYCHPLFDERKCAHRFSYQLAKTFKENDFYLERFDYYGTGESKGAFCEVTLESLRLDIHKIINNERACLIGSRFGATIAFDYCCQNASEIPMLIMIEPIINGNNYIEYLFKRQHIKNLMTGNNSEFVNINGFYNIEGYKTNKVLIEQIKQINLNHITENIKISNIGIIQITSSKKVNPEYESLIKHLDSKMIHNVIEVSNVSMFWERIPQTDYSALTNKIVAWLK